MEFDELVRRRRMVRSFAPDPLPAELVDGLLDLARRAPSAGNTSSVEFLVLTGSAETARYWDTTIRSDQRIDFGWPDLLAAPVLVVVWVDPAAYVARYAEPDKVATGLGESEDSWSVPYWWVDGGAAVMTLLHGAVDRGLGAAFFGVFEHEPAIRRRFGVPSSRRAVGTVALGHPVAGRPGRSAGRVRPTLEQIVHRGRWPTPDEPG